jgi:hypothetical protein
MILSECFVAGRRKCLFDDAGYLGSTDSISIGMSGSNAWKFTLDPPKKMALDDLFPGISDWPLLGSAESALPRVAVMSYYRAFKSCPVALLRGHCRGWTRWRWVPNLGGVLV